MIPTERRKKLRTGGHYLLYYSTALAVVWTRKRAELIEDIARQDIACPLFVRYLYGAPINAHYDCTQAIAAEVRAYCNLWGLPCEFEIVESYENMKPGVPV